MRFLKKIFFDCKKYTYSDIKELIEQSNFIIENCKIELMNTVLDKKEYLCHLPLINEDNSWMDEDNWDLSEKRKDIIKKNIKNLEKYASYIIEIYKHNIHKKGFNKNNFNYELLYKTNEVLPPWIIFPLYNNNSIYWKYDLAKDYMDAFNMYVNIMPLDNKTEYFREYPVPSYLWEQFMYLTEDKVI